MDQETRREMELNVLRSAIDNIDRLYVLLTENENLFTDPTYRSIFRTIQRLSEDGRPVDAIALYAAAQGDGLNEERLRSFQISFSTAPGTLHIERLIEELKRQNTLQKIKEMTVGVYNGIKKKQMTFEQMAEEIAAVHEAINTVDEDSAIELKDMGDIPLDDLYHAGTFYRTGIEEIDKMILGIFKTQLFVIAARPGLGKTSLALQIAQNLPGKGLFFSLEMNRAEMYARVLSQHSEVESWKIECKKATDAEMRRITEAHATLKDRLRVKLYDKISDLSQILNAIRREKGIKWIVVDYLQLMSGAQGENRNLQISSITRALKQAAGKSGLPIILLSQLNREVEHKDREPMLADLRDSGSIEQDADVVVFIHHKDGKFSYIVAKNRKGKTGKIPTFFQKKYFRFGLAFQESDNLDLPGAPWIGNPEYFHN